MIADIEVNPYLIGKIETYGVLPYLGKIGKGFMIQQHPTELATFIEFCQQHDVRTVLELGTGDGGLAYFMADALGWDVVSIDIHVPKHRHEQVEFIQGTTDAMYQYVMGRAFDLVFIDASHEYPDVKSDHERYAHLGRIVAFHDINASRQCCAGVARRWHEIVDGKEIGHIDSDDRVRLAHSSDDKYHSVVAIDGKDAPGIGWYLNDDFNPGQTRWELYSGPLPDAIPDICVVSGTRDRLPYLTRMIESARANVPRGITLHFVIVDGGSVDGTLDYLRAQPDVHLIEHGEKRGIAAAYRDGFDAAHGKYIVTGNDDIEFIGGCLWNALNHLEQNSAAGGVAFYFDTPEKPGAFHVNVQGVSYGASPQYDSAAHGVGYVPYAQVGMFRKWIGDAAGWWGGHDPKFPAHNYGLDNYLTSRVLEMGYTVDAVKECQFHDLVVQDALRAGNAYETLHSGKHPDSQIWRDRFNGGFPSWNITPIEPQKKQATQHLRILYTPILAAKTEHERNQLCGWLHSLQKVGIVVQYDYVQANRARRDVGGELVALIKEFKPHIWFSQIQEASVITPQIYYKARAAHTSMVAVNWNGDEMRDIWNNRALVDIMRAADLQLTVNPSLFPGAVQHGVNMALMLDSFQPIEPVEMPEFDVVFLGTNYAPRHTPGKFPRREMIEAIRQRLPHVKLGVYGNHWPDAVEENTYSYDRNHGAYAAAKLAIVDNMYQDVWGYVSDRFYNALAYSQCVLFRSVEGLATLFDLHPDEMAFEWTDYEDLTRWIKTLLDPTNEEKRKQAGQKARQHMHEYHTFDARVRELIDHEHGLIAALVKKK